MPDIRIYGHQTSITRNAACSRTRVLVARRRRHAGYAAGSGGRAEHETWRDPLALEAPPRRRTQAGLSLRHCGCLAGRPGPALRKHDGPSDVPMQAICCLTTRGRRGVVSGCSRPKAARAAHLAGTPRPSPRRIRTRLQCRGPTARMCGMLCGLARPAALERTPWPCVVPSA